MKVTSPACNDLDPFFDGELTPSGAAAFRDHIADCARCEQILHGRMLEAVATSKVPRAPVIPNEPPQHPERPEIPQRPELSQRPQKRRWAWAGGAAAALVAACVALWLHDTGTQRGDDENGRSTSRKNPSANDLDAGIKFALAPKRGLEARFSAKVFDGYRELEVMRSAPAPIRESISLDSLAALEKRDANALVAGLALNGDLASATTKAKALPVTAASLADRAGLALAEVGDPHKAQANAEHALSLARQALRLEPKHPQAMWNEAVALERLQLSLIGAGAFEAIAKLGEPGWSGEAKQRAERLRAAYRDDLDQRQQLYDAAISMIRGGAPMEQDLVARDESFARLAFHLAVASTADASRFAAFAPIANQLNMTDELAAIRASNLAVRAPLARELAGVTGKLTSLLPPRADINSPPTPSVVEALRGLRSRARARGHADISRAVALLIEERQVNASDIAELPAVSSGGPWWKLVAVQRHIYYLTYTAHRPVETDLIARDVVGSCRDGLWCSPILRTLATTNSDIGRVDRAYQLAADALRMARSAADRKEEGRVFYVTGQVAARRVVEWLDSAAIADAYMHESTLRFNDCQTRLYRLDWRALTLLDYHRFSEAEQLLDEADRTQSECKTHGRFNGEYVRARLIAHRPAAERVAQVERQVQTIPLSAEEDVAKGERLFVEFLPALARFAASDNEQTAAALKQVLAKADALQGAHYPNQAREDGYSALAERAARRGAAEESLIAIAARARIPLEPGCVVAVNHDDRVTIVVRGADNQVAAEIRTPPEGNLVIPPRQLVSRALLARLVGCPSIDVLATGSYFGAALLLPRELRWAYRSSSSRPGPHSSRLSRQVVVTDVEPPAELGLPPLRSMYKTDASARLITRAMATPNGVLAAITDAELVLINAHGITDANEPSAASLVLSADRDGAYWLTAERVKQTRFTAAPVVILAACHAGRVQVSKSPWSLASSFLSAGARAVIAPTVEIPDDVANEVFGSMVKRMRSGSSPEQAVAEEREARGDVPWLASVVVFQ